MTLHATIEIPSVRSRQAAIRELQTMLNDYEDNNPDAKDIHIRVEPAKKTKASPTP